jgi:hypothetical protein
MVRPPALKVQRLPPRELSDLPAIVGDMTTPGAHDFDFIYGRWTVHNRKLRDVTDPACEDWVEFDATSEVFPVLHGYGHIDRMEVPQAPDGAGFEGMTLRLFDPSLDTWSIWWSSTRAPGRLDPPVVGSFADGQGIFECDDLVNGHPVRLRFQWTADDSSPVWRQFFSYDAGATWRENWRMSFSRR